MLPFSVSATGLRCSARPKWLLVADIAGFRRGVRAFPAVIFASVWKCALQIRLPVIKSLPATPFKGDEICNRLLQRRCAQAALRSWSARARRGFPGLPRPADPPKMPGEVGRPFSAAAQGLSDAPQLESPCARRRPAPCISWLAAVQGSTPDGQVIISREDGAASAD